MTSPFLQPAWTIEEAILLVEASENVASGRVEVESVISQLSERLRRGSTSYHILISTFNDREISLHIKGLLKTNACGTLEHLPLLKNFFHILRSKFNICISAYYFNSSQRTT